MAQLLCIGDKLNRKGVQEKGDIVGYFDDDHKFSPDELELFDIVPLSGYTAMEASTEIEMRMAPVDDKAGTWMDGAVKRTLEDRPKFRASIKGLSAQQLSDMGNKNAPDMAKRAAFDHMTDRLAELSANQTISLEEVA